MHLLTIFYNKLIRYILIIINTFICYAFSKYLSISRELLQLVHDTADS